ncbi:hypothetical protein CEXT_49451 [Caerostris extrusa]|uniref:Uncharacterized protein n=1 Tax=Caerostris extrusa TaxID=172846 RepID=A0AAV4XMK9_CAEEX|nr:hypothetical protein CEXT_49451 [Caerostris extrusa]
MISNVTKKGERESQWKSLFGSLIRGRVDDKARYHRQDIPLWNHFANEQWSRQKNPRSTMGCSAATADETGFFKVAQNVV